VEGKLGPTSRAQHDPQISGESGGIQVPFPDREILELRRIWCAVEFCPSSMRLGRSASLHEVRELRYDTVWATHSGEIMGKLLMWDKRTEESFVFGVVIVVWCGRTRRIEASRTGRHP
jgi:hypothetical protein